MTRFRKDTGDFLPFYISHGGKDFKDGPVFLRKA